MKIDCWLPSDEEDKAKPCSKIEFFLIKLIRICGLYKARIYLDFNQEWMECMEHNLFTPIGTSYHSISDCVHFDVSHENSVEHVQCWINSILTFTRPRSLTFIYYYNRLQNELRHFAVNWAFLHFTDFKRRKYSFSSLIPSMQNSSTPNLNGGGRGGVRILLFSEVTLFEYNVSTILSLTVVIESLVR